MQPHKFLDEIAYENAGQDEELIGKADALYKLRMQKSRYIVWDIDTFALNQQNGKGRQVPHFLVAATCYRYFDKPFKKQICATRECISNDTWKIDNVHIKVSCWADAISYACEECRQQQLIIRLGNTKALFKGFTLVAHNGAGFDNHYLFQYLIKKNGLAVDPIYSGSKLLRFTAKKSAKDKDYLIRGIDSAQFFLAQLKSLPKQFGLDISDFKKGIFPYKFHKPDQWNYVDKYSDISFYAPNEMSSDEAAEIKTWHQQQQYKVFNFRKEMVDYCLQDVWILLSAVQVAVREDFDLMEVDGMAECCTIASKTIMFFRHGFLKDNTKGVISQMGIAGRRNHSYESLLWLLLQEIHYPNLQHALSTRGEKVLLKAPVDGFHEATNAVFQFHGCFWHGCPKCY